MAHVQVFLPGGRYQKTIGRNGAGPGEFRQVGAMWLMAGDSLAVHDGTLHRVTVFDPARPLRPNHPGGPIGAVLLRRLVLSQPEILGAPGGAR